MDQYRPNNNPEHIPDTPDAQDGQDDSLLVVPLSVITGVPCERRRGIKCLRYRRPHCSRPNLDYVENLYGLHPVPHHTMVRNSS